MKKIALAVMAAVFALAGCSKKNVQNAKITKDNLKVGFVYIGSIHDEGYTTAQDKGRLPSKLRESKQCMSRMFPRMQTARKLSAILLIRDAM